MARLSDFLGSAVESDRDSARDRWLAAEAYIVAIEEAAKVTAYYRKDDALYVGWQAAQVLFNLGHPRQAEQEVRAALARDPGQTGMHIQARLLHARLLRMLGDASSAEQCLTDLEAISLDAVDPATARLLRGAVVAERVLLLCQIGLPDRAVSFAEQYSDWAASRRTAEPPEFGPWALSVVMWMDLHAARGDFQAVLRTEAAAREQSDWDRCPPDLRRKASLRGAIARAELLFRGEEPAFVGDPEASLRDAISSSIDEADRLLALYWLGDLYLTRGDFERARRELLALEDRVRDAGDGLERDALHALLLRITLEELDPGPDGRPGVAVIESLREHWHRLLDRWRELGSRETGLALLHFLDRTDVLCALAHAHIAGDPAGGGAAAALKEVLEAQEVGTFSIEVGARAPSLQVFQRELLPPGGGAMLYLPGRRKSLLFLVDAGAIEAIPLGPQAELKDAIRDLEFELVRAQASVGDRLWRSVEIRLQRVDERLLPAPARRWLSGIKSLTFIAPANAPYFPIEGLCAGEEVPLGCRMPVRYLPSLPVASWLDDRRARRGARPGDLDLALLCASDPGAEASARHHVERLSTDDALVDRWAAPFAGRSEVRTNDRATRAALEQLLAARPTLLTVVAHGLYAASEPRPARLLLAGDDGVLTPEEVEGWAFAPATVFLGVCGAWSGPLRRGDDGRSHLSGALLLAGADEVVLPAARVRYSIACELAALFHENLRTRGLSAMDALWEARATLYHRAESVEARIAPMLVHLVGLGDRPVFPKRSAVGARITSRWPAPIAVVVLAFSMGVLWVRSRRR